MKIMTFIEYAGKLVEHDCIGKKIVTPDGKVHKVIGGKIRWNTHHISFLTEDGLTMVFHFGDDIKMME